MGDGREGDLAGSPAGDGSLEERVGMGRGQGQDGEVSQGREDGGWCRG